jgi:GH18 family chitinase
LLQQLRESLDRGFTTIHLRVDVSNNSSSSLSTPIADSVGHKLLTVAVNSTPFFKNSTPLIDVSAYAQIIDWIFVKAYDMYVDKPMTGPNAPLKSSMQEGASTQSFDQAWITWTEAHMPANKIVMGLSFHGYISKPKEDAIQLKRLLVSSHMVRPQGDSEDDLSVVLSPPCPELKRGYSGLWKWRSLVSSGVLLDTKTPGGQWIKNWDQESQTPWLYNPITRYLISYDDPESIAIKVNYTRCKEARGVGIWDLSYDAYTNKQGQLLEVVNRYLYNTSSSFGACLNLNPIASYKVVGPQFNALSTKRVFSKASKISAVNLLLLLVILATGISL